MLNQQKRISVACFQCSLHKKIKGNFGMADNFCNEKKQKLATVKILEKVSFKWN